MEFSILEWIWIAQSMLVVLLAAYYVIHGRIIEGLKPDEKKPMGLIHFNKRVYDYYVVAFVWVGLLLWTALRAYCQQVAPYEFVTDGISVLTSGRNTASTDATTTVLLLVLFLVNTARRLYECWSVSIFSYRATVSIFGLLLSYGFYICLGFTFVAESPSFTEIGDDVSLFKLTWYHAIGIGLFTVASRKHHNAHRILAKLRRNRAGHIVTTGYKIPRGDWFDFVSCPHYLAEVLVFLSFCTITAFQNRTLILCSIYVFSNQVFLAHNTHAWYKRKFEDYPQMRKMLIPFVL